MDFGPGARHGPAPSDLRGLGADSVVSQSPRALGGPRRVSRRPNGPRGDSLKVLIAGMGNVLRGDDAFGVVVAERLMAMPGWCPGGWEGPALSRGSRAGVPALAITVREFGIGGVHLVQELLHGYEALLLLDAVRQGSAPGTLHVLEPVVPDLSALSLAARRDFLSDMHWATPDRALILAKGLGVLPPRVRIIGCEPEAVDGLSLAMSAVVERTVPAALAMVAEALEHWL